jgi:hypothetical protein
MTATIGHNNPPISAFVETINLHAADAARDVLRGGVGLRVLATALLNRCVTDGATLEGEKVNTYRLAGIADGRRKIGDKPVKLTVNGRDYAVTAALHPAEIAKVKQAFSGMFSDIAFFVGELTATDVAVDVAAIKTDLLAGVTAISTAKRAINAARAKAEKEAEKAEKEAAAISLMESGELLPLEGAPIVNAACVVATILELAEQIAALALPLRGDANEISDAISLLVTVWNDKAEQNDTALIAADENNEAIAA